MLQSERLVREMLYQHVFRMLSGHLPVCPAKSGGNNSAPLLDPTDHLIGHFEQAQLLYLLSLCGPLILPLRLLLTEEVYSYLISVSNLDAFTTSFALCVKILPSFGLGGKNLYKQAVISDVPCVCIGYPSIEFV